MNALDRQHHANGAGQHQNDRDRAHTDFHHLMDHSGKPDGLSFADAE